MKKIVDAIKAINPKANMMIREDIDHITWTHGTSPISKTDIEAKMAELKLNEPMELWRDKMNDSDSTIIPRWMEDHVESEYNGIVKSSKLQEKYDSKVCVLWR